MRMVGQRLCLAALRLGNRPLTHCREDWRGPSAGLDGYRKPRPHGFRTADHPSPSGHCTDCAIEAAHGVRTADHPPRNGYCTDCAIEAAHGFRTADHPGRSCHRTDCAIEAADLQCTNSISNFNTTIRIV
jgi:hypothetical protein